MTDNITIIVEPGTYSICRLPSDTAWPPVPEIGFVAFTVARPEYSLVCDSGQIPDVWKREGRIESGYTLMRVDGPLPFSAVGIIAKISGALSGASIPVFVLSTFDTDYILVTRDRRNEACIALERVGISIG